MGPRLRDLAVLLSATLLVTSCQEQQGTTIDGGAVDNGQNATLDVARDDLARLPSDASSPEDGSWIDAPAADLQPSGDVSLSDLGAGGDAADAVAIDRGPPPECSRDGDCDDRIGCTVDRCTDGRCARSPDDTLCDDRVACTDDRCGATGCQHAPVPARCSAGQMCDPMRGCMGGRICATNSDCADTDPCTTNERCDPASRVCQYSVLDGDGDGFPPRVCGGTDCDDGNRFTNPMATESCNGRDDDCDGMVDDARAAESCGTGFSCNSGRCVCPPGTSDACELRRCVDSRTDREHCGACGRTCGPMGTCQAGMCACPAGSVYCLSGGCVDLTTSMTHCGACGNRCPSGTTCTSGVCRCPGLLTLCDTRCVDTQANALSCGSCTTVCPSGSTCENGACQCPSGQSLCAGRCLDTRTDPANCGECGRRCDEGLDGGTAQSCVQGTCRCPNGFELCNGRCIDTQSDPRNCGACGAFCDYGSDVWGTEPRRGCFAGTCQCAPGTSLCGMNCFALDFDPANCGACGRRCASGERCIDGACRTLGAAWTRVMTSNRIEVRGVAADGVGNVFLAGNFGGTIDPGGVSLSTSIDDGFIASYNPTGTLRWARRVPGGSGSIRAITLDSDGNVIVGGSFSESVTIGATSLSSRGWNDAFVLSLGNDGTPRWAVSFGGIGYDAVTAIAAGRDGRIAILLSVNGELTIAGRTFTPAFDGIVNGSVVAATLDRTGVVQWARLFEGPSLAGGVAIDPSGNVVVAGLFSGWLALAGGSPARTAGGTDFFAASFGSGGDVRWFEAFGSIYNEDQMDLATDGVGNVYLAGTSGANFTYRGSRVSFYWSGFSGFVLSLSSSGALRWHNTLSGRGTGAVADIAIDSSDNVHIVGTFTDSFTLSDTRPRAPFPDLGSAGRLDGFNASYTAQGAIRWARRVGGSADDGLSRVGISRPTSAVVGGLFASPSIDFGSGPVTALSGPSTVFVSRLSP